MRARLSSTIRSWSAVERGFGGAGLAVAFLIGEVAGLLDGGHRPVLGSKRASMIFAVVTDGDAIALLLLGGGLGLGADVDGVEGLDAVLRGVGDDHVLAGQGAVMLRRAGWGGTRGCRASG